MYSNCKHHQLLQLALISAFCNTWYSWCIWRLCCEQADRRKSKVSREINLSLSNQQARSVCSLCSSTGCATTAVNINNLLVYSGRVVQIRMAEQLQTFGRWKYFNLSISVAPLSSALTKHKFCCLPYKIVKCVYYVFYTKS